MPTIKINLLLTRGGQMSNVKTWLVNIETYSGLTSPPGWPGVWTGARGTSGSQCPPHW